ncbi:hypothetical protein TPHV1_10046 [Treponema phagedenis]|uniref:Uncharacterized protein n=1 Tax=Treponema phagedenis TaxID=162 RepID=A0A0B7GPK6_TREPH|nr:hypothetical protein TPHV1_10046 [Treponema phagedenis]
MICNTEKLPVIAMLEAACDNTVSKPIDTIGEKSTIPARINLKRLNQSKYGSQIVDKNVPTCEYNNCGAHERKILAMHKSEYIQIKVDNVEKNERIIVTPVILSSFIRLSLKK